MYFYILVLAILIVLTIIEIVTDNKKIVFWAGSLLALIAGFRYYTGYDFETYREYFYRVQTFQDVLANEVLEPGYLALSYGFSQIGFNYPTFVLFMALVSLGLLTYFLYKHFPYPTVAMTYYYARFYHLRDMAQVRSSLASIILLFSLTYIIEEKFWKFVLVIAVAMMFHAGSFVFIMVYPLHVLIKRLNYQNIVILFALAIGVGMIIQFPGLYEWAVPARYISYVVAPSRMGGPWYTNSVVLMQIIIFGAGAYFIKVNDENEEKKIDVILKIYLLATLALIASNTLRVLGGRISTFLATVEILLVPYLIFNLTKNKAANLLGYIFFTSAIFVLIFIISGRYIPYLPYRTIFNY